VKYFLGCSGWYYEHWVGKFYPEDLSKQKWLQYYSRNFNTVEVNNTFYRFPTKQMLSSWYKRSPNEFIFALKANWLITHRKRFRDSKGLIERFYQIGDELKEKLGCILFQLPPKMEKDLALLEKILEQLDLRRNNIIEFRHKSWFNKEVYDILRKNSLGFCIVSEPEFPENLVVTARNAYIRFHGKGENWYQYKYSQQELKNWAKQIHKLDANRLFCYFNNDYKANAVINCQQLKELLQ
jgi:uncharacterized protein YecE (DUF72 family)